MITVDNLSESQLRAFDLIVKPTKKITRVTGYAGTGKTTVLAAAAHELGDECCVLSPTNKAAKVLREKGVDRAQTVHSLLYTPSEIQVFKKDDAGNVIYHKKEDGSDMRDERGMRIPVVQHTEMGFSLKDGRDHLPRTAIIDEASMIGKEIYADLCDTFDNIILVGDGFQLPPVMDTDVLNLEQPDIALTEVHRVALDNPIIRFATDIRNGLNPSLDAYNCHEIRNCSKDNSKLFPALVDNNCQVICGLNKTRHMINDNIRAAKGYPANTLLKGEEVVCLENWREEDEDYEGNRIRVLVFYNGETVIVSNDNLTTEDDFIAKIVNFETKDPKFVFPFWNPGYFNLFDARNTAWYNEYRRRQGTNKKPLRGIKMDYSYGITAHKSQGSEYENVAVFDERWASKGSEQRWFYTAVTRAKKRLLVVR